jgi:alpha-tubulin suppressor-like RCC1 family protein
MWGNNTYGQVGVDDSVENEIYMPKRVPLDAPCLMVACGLYHTCCIVQYYRIYSWGNNTHGQLGIGNFSSTHVPTEIEKLRGEVCNMVACGYDNSMATNEVGKVFGWGNNAYYKMGIEKILYKAEQVSTGKNTPRPMEYFIPLQRFGRGNEFFKQLKLEKTYSMGVTNFDRVFYWGFPPDSTAASLDVATLTSEPEKKLGLRILKEESPTDNVQNFSLLKSNSNTYDEREKENLKNKKEEGEYTLKVSNGRMINVPISLEDPKNSDYHDRHHYFVKVGCGDNYTVVLTYFGELLVWGSNLNGQHGTNSDEIQRAYKEFFTTGLAKKVDNMYTMECFPHFITYFGIDKNRRITNFSCGARHVLAIENGLVAYAWGDNTSGQLGLNLQKTERVMFPQKIIEVSGMELVECQASTDFSIILTKSGDLWSCGSNRDGKLGLGMTDPWKIIYVMTKLSQPENVVKVSAGPNHVLAICEVKVLDENIFDELARIEEEENKPKIEKKDKQTDLYSWGNGSLGQLGLKKLESVNTPAKVEIKGDFVDISAGFEHSAAVTSEGKMFLWGLGSRLPSDFIDNVMLQNRNVVIDKGSDKVISEPVEFKTRSSMTNTQVTFSSVSLGTAYNLAVARDNAGFQVYEWGYFLHDTKIDERDRRKANREIPSFTGALIAVGFDHAAAISPDGRSVYCWGIDNYTGKLGHMVTAIQSKKDSDNKNEEKKNLNSYQFNATEVSYTPEQVNIIPSLLAQRVDEIHNKNAKASDGREDKDKGSVSKSALMSEGTTEMSAVENSMSQSESKRTQKVKAVHLLGDEYLSYLQLNAQQAFLSLINHINEYNDAIAVREEQMVVLRNALFCRINEDPFHLTIQDPLSIPRDQILNTQFNEIVLTNLITAFQLHPCLLLKLVEPAILRPSGSSQMLNPEEFANFVWQVYGAINFDERKEALFLNLVEGLLSLELRNEKNFENIIFFDGDDFISMRERQKVPINYTNMLINKVIDSSIERRSEVDSM